jgi:hypothetical protein
VHGHPRLVRALSKLVAAKFSPSKGKGVDTGGLPIQSLIHLSVHPLKPLLAAPQSLDLARPYPDLAHASYRGLSTFTIRAGTSFPHRPIRCGKNKKAKAKSAWTS